MRLNDYNSFHCLARALLKTTFEKERHSPDPQKEGKPKCVVCRISKLFTYIHHSLWAMVTNLNNPGSDSLPMGWGSDSLDRVNLGLTPWCIIWIKAFRECPFPTLLNLLFCCRRFPTQNVKGGKTTNRNGRWCWPDEQQLSFSFAGL